MKTIKSLLIELDDDLHAALDRFIADTGSIASPAEAMRAAFRDWAISQGYMNDLSLDEESPHEGEA